jgi:hypothetical protein
MLRALSLVNMIDDIMSKLSADGTQMASTGSTAQKAVGEAQRMARTGSA